MKKVFIVTPNNIIDGYCYPWFVFAETIEEVEAKFEGCSVEEDK